jgi:hypothetical protein
MADARWEVVRRNEQVKHYLLGSGEGSLRQKTSPKHSFLFINIFKATLKVKQKNQKSQIIYRGRYSDGRGKKISIKLKTIGSFRQ